MKKTLCALAALEFCMLSAAAAPLDAFLTANHSATPWTGHVEAAYDVTNDTVDVFGVREKNTASSRKLGDYQGGHLSGGVAVTPRLWLDGTFWQRNIEARSFDAKVSTWQLAAQYQLMEANGYAPRLALRAGAWGNYAKELSREKDMRVGTILLESARVTKPKDTQYQLDLIGTWPVSANAELTLFGSAGASRVTIGGASATTTIGDCRYNLVFGPTHVVGDCSSPSMDAHFSTPNSAYDIDINREARYHARFYQAGASAKWHSDNWQLRAGYQYHVVNRGELDDIVSRRGGTNYKNNHIVVADVAYRLARNTSVFLRGQYMARQFNGEMPMAYNSLTAASFDQRYGIVSVGLMTSF